MRIAILCSGSAVFGMEIIAIGLARGLRERGHDVRFIVSGWNDGDFIQRLSAGGFDFQPILLGKISKSLAPRAIQWTLTALIRLPGARRQARRFLNRVRPDAVIVNHRDWALLLGSILERERVIFHVHELPVATSLMSRAYRHIDTLVAAFAAVSENVALRLQALGVSREKTHVIRNGIEVPPIVSRHSELPNSSSPVICIVGQIGQWKGHDDLIAALGILHARGLAFRCSIFGVGDEQYVSRLKAMTRELGIVDLVTWHGYVRDTAAIYGKMDICVVPSRFDDPFPTVAIEAALRSIPVIATRRGGLPEIVIDGETGFLVAPENPSEIADRLAQLIEDSALRSRMGNSARARAQDRFTTARMVDRMESLLMKVSGSEQRHGS